MRNIQETGIRGYLKWLQQDQPGIYARAAPMIAQQVPEAFSDREQSMAMGALMGFADAPGATEFYGDTAPFDDSASVPTGGNAATTDVASAANSGAASSGTTSIIGNIVNSVAQYFLTKQEADITRTANEQQLQLAAAGLPPNQTSTAALGVRKVLAAGTGAGSGTVGNVVAVGLLAAGLWFAFGRRRA